MWTNYSQPIIVNQYVSDDWVSTACKILKWIRFTIPERTKLIMFKYIKSSN